jgi:hypothetical protein
MPPWASMVLPLVSFHTAPGVIQDAASETVAALNQSRRLENNIVRFELMVEKKSRE